MRNQTAFGGWLYADLLLVLFVVFLAAAGGNRPPQVRPTPVPSVTPSPTPTCATSVVLKKHELSLPVGPEADGLPGDANLQGAFQQFNGQVAGIVLTFVHAPTPDDGQSLSARVNDHLRRLFPTMFPTGVTIMENFFSQDAVLAHRGSVDFHVYLLTPVCAP